SEGLSTQERIKPRDFAAALSTGVSRAYEAIYQPVEGTMLTIIREWTEAVEKHKTLEDFRLIFDRSIKPAKKALDRTTSQLSVLKDAHVVDAGAEGFFEFLRGIAQFFASGHVTEGPKVEEIDQELHQDIHGGEYPLFRYCTEGLIRGRTMDTEALRRQLVELGDSLIVAGGAGLLRVHIHTDNPAEVFRILEGYGTITEQKVADMVRKYEVSHDRKYPIALVTDSVCDLPRQLIDHYQIHVVPMNIHFGSVRYLDGITIKAADIYQNIDTVQPYPGTSQPSPKDFRLLYSFLSTYYQSVIAIHVSAALSGTYGVSLREAQRLSGTKISVLDSRLNSGAQAMLVLRAAEAIAAGKSHEEVVREIESSRRKTKIYVSVQTLRYMVKGGRVSPLKGMAAGLLNLKPIVSLDEEGKSVLIGKAFSRAQARRRLLALAEEVKRRGPLKYYGVVHAESYTEAQSFAAELEQMFGSPPLFVQEISPIIGLHAGRGSYALVTMRE
ncbi:MAG TPA: DegV family protein, partial [Sediminispirochaeta sp.]|nr:DegV family protein [Sediminispirochaeta sp.]